MEVDLTKSYKFALFKERAFSKNVGNYTIGINTYTLRAYTDRPWYDLRNTEQPIIVMIVNGAKGKWFHKIIDKLEANYYTYNSTRKEKTLSEVKELIGQCKYAKKYSVLWKFQ